MTAILIALVILAQPGPPAVAETHVETTVRGTATWYGTGPGAGHAAAGSELRSALGRDWRGTRVSVCHEQVCVAVRITDWCACKGARIIDLSDEDFSTLAPLGAGVIKVRVTAGGGQTHRPAQVFVLPETHAVTGAIGKWFAL